MTTGDGENPASPPPEPPPSPEAPAESRPTGWRNWGDHPIVVGITVLTGIFAIYQVIRPGSSSSDPPAKAAVTCASIAGRWDWLSTGGVVAFTADGAMHWYQIPTDRLPQVSGHWECSAGRRPPHYTLRWTQTGLVDTVALSADGEALAGENLANHFKLSATRAR